MKRLLTLSRLIDSLNERVGSSVYWLILVMVVISALNAVFRKFFNMSSNAFLEIQWYLFAAVFLLGAGYTLLKNEHVRIDVIAGNFGSKGQIWIDIIGTVLFLFPFTGVVLYGAWPYFVQSFLSQEWSSNPGGLIVWPVKLLIPLGFFLLFLQGVSQLIKLIGVLRGKGDMGKLLKHHSVAEDAVELVSDNHKND